MAARAKKKPSILLNRTIIIGCGKLGAAIANERWKLGKNVIVVDSKESSFLLLNKDFSGETVLASAMDFDKLEEAGIKSANEVIIVTGDDNINIYLAYAICHRYCSGIDIFVRLDDVNRGVLLADLPVKPIYPLELSFEQYRSNRDGGKK